ncbi:hypothetical protein H490_0101620 [Leucobacter sp. UCD-THU]|uniref:hypothetical protein n=1 Tax=Leucobacter sp. UCD-THU TaxID=1292023 RepID=UPI00035D5C84|nr:hypothetical protein [Leucobacter sp. UCD-THU]EYT56664.1 hypothetical protein H490_0101620 [Leucobacter sp. UCD-THU]
MYPSQTHPADDAFTTDEGLRKLLGRLAERPELWQRDPEARALIEYTMRRYERLARKWNRDPGEAAAAAFVVMRRDYILSAEKPWAIVTVAVRAAMIAESQAERLLISPTRAQKEDVTDLDRPIRAGEHEDYLYSVLSPGPETEPDSSPLLAQVQFTIVGLFACLSWDRKLAQAATEYVLARMMTAMDAGRAYQYLRRDQAAPVLLDLDLATWRGLARILVGTPGGPGLPGRRGLIARIVLELERGLTPVDVIDELLRDDRLIIDIFDLRPRK